VLTIVVAMIAVAAIGSGVGYLAHAAFRQRRRRRRRRRRQLAVLALVPPVPLVPPLGHSTLTNRVDDKVSQQQASSASKSNGWRIALRPRRIGRATTEIGNAFVAHVAGAGDVLAATEKSLLPPPERPCGAAALSRVNSPCLTLPLRSRRGRPSSEPPPAASGAR
jgi:hypothetical protein